MGKYGLVSSGSGFGLVTDSCQYGKLCFLKALGLSSASQQILASQ
jgi:hypothetical protein